MNQASEPVSVTILDRKYQFACTPEERKNLIEAARDLDERMKEIRESGHLMSLERIALQAALNLTDQVLKMQRRAADREERIDSRIRLLTEQLDNALKE
ncbi:cell division protein ZapA [Elongatibacter sediminis]|uniref:Cell division protein ZapA n=1 Tax=Elongatibacter sediminis TaxID=3119006 RepID=A0AAW9RAL8_9GAMM